MNEIKWNRIVVVTALHGEKYLGYVPGEVKTPSEYIRDRCSQRLPITLEDARTLVSQVQVGPRGEIGRMLLLMPVDFWPGPIPSINIVPSSWSVPADNEQAKKQIEKLLQHAEENESRFSASEAGLVVDHRSPILPGQGQVQ